MSSELERRLEGLLTEAPDPDPGAGEEALHRALQALHPVAPARRGLRTAVLVFAAAAVLLAIAAGSLAAAGALHVSFGREPKPSPVTTQLVLPKGANGIAAIVDGRLSVVIKGGFRLQGQRATAVAISPHALFVAVGIGHSLVAMAPSGRQAWSHPADGSVVAVSWAPFGNRIAYVVHRNRQFVLHVIWGNGTNDAVVDHSVRAVQPSWRNDSLAFAYVGAGGKAIVYDLGHKSRSVISTRASGGVSQVAFAPSGKLLAIATRTDVAVLRPGLNQIEDHGQIEAIGWTGRWFAVVHGGSHPVIELTANPQLGELHPAGTIQAFEAQGHGLAVAISRNADTRVLVAVSGDRLRSVLQLPAAAHVSGLVLG